MNDFTVTERTRAKRLFGRARYDRETVHAILDAGLVCHIGYEIDGQPYVTPTAYWREGGKVYWHGSAASRMLRHQASGAPLCLTVSHLDGFVLARSGFHHSVNYRSVMILGRAKVVIDGADKIERMKVFIDGLFPGRWDELRPITAQEVKATTVLYVDLDEVSAKVRTGMPVDDEEDYRWPCWAGVLPVGTRVGEPQPCPRLIDGIEPPTYLDKLRLG
jgi:nitroimidazol reductase NimA-like FMN-containing flavoprotein (pyridoxamine 5'-phosphate oxidase superfamily)